MMKLNWHTNHIGLDPKTGELSGRDLSSMAPEYVYVIRVPKQQAIGYDTGVSQICYVGRSGRSAEKKSRLNAHMTSWMFRYLALTPGSQPFRVSYCHDDVNGNAIDYKHVEAVVLRDFMEKFGRLPLFNKRNEKIKSDSDIDLNCRFMTNKRLEPTIQAHGITAEQVLNDDEYA